MDLLDRLVRNNIEPKNIEKVMKFLSAIEPVSRSTVQENLCLMINKEKGGMNAYGESVQGRGTILFEGRKIAFEQLNFYHDYDSGKILYFGNPQDVPEEIKEAGCLGYYHLAIDYKSFRQFICKTKVEKSSQHGAGVISLTVQTYNKMWGL